MEFEYSQEVKGKVIAFRFEKWEQLLIAKSLKPEVKKLQKKIASIWANPKNEGQATYATKIDAIRQEIKEIENIIESMS